MEYEVIAEGLRFPEGPVVMSDGSVIVVEIESKQITRCWPDGKRETVAEPGGGPNGLAIGPDGKLWCTNNGGFIYHERDGLLIPGHCPPDYSGGRIERIALETGKVEVVATECEGRPLKGPNDLVIDKAGNLYFTDLGKSYPTHRDTGGLYFLASGSDKVQELDYNHISPNGIGLSPDEQTVYFADTMSARVWAYDLESPGVAKQATPFSKGRVVAGMPDLRYFDSLAISAAGNVCVATILQGGITTVKPDGNHSHIAFPDPFVTNIAFGGEDMRDAYITLSGTGQLIKCRWPEAGLKLNFNA
ncbi:SMP-30/gluconolactonase/LRE family protein [Henriciella algicola]|uniref:SMP-30/gluconolactonase/LRE family protein n=1 Tax=Henriciella algicola TaxID=1608422 RepID=A0A399RN75_9PROT|nr:SMP-30/gluconolactonase/LRE family protein [Henriciella algicola]RIJ31262.1 SMP-30/gluconolactonase/LRE family protein [Henriciella algicola]